MGVHTLTGARAGGYNWGLRYLPSIHESDDRLPRHSPGSECARLPYAIGGRLEGSHGPRPGRQMRRVPQRLRRDPGGQGGATLPPDDAIVAVVGQRALPLGQTGTER